jgi:hypothetical protein
LIEQTRFSSGDTLKGSYDIQLLKRGETNTRIYAVHYVAHDASVEKRFLIYIPTQTLYAIGAEVTAKVAAEQAQDRHQQSTTEGATASRVQ